MYSTLETLKLNHLFKHYLIVDAVRVPDIQTLAYQHEPAPDLKLLYAHSPLEHLAEASPVVFTFTGEQSLVALLEDDVVLRSSSVVVSFIPSKDEREILDHLRSLMIVKINNHLTLFRFYSAAFWEQVKNDIQQQDIDTILGPLSQLCWCRDDKSWQSFRHEPQALASPPFDFVSNIIAEQV